MKIYLAGIPPGGAAAELLSVERHLENGEVYRRLVSYYYMTSAEEVIDAAAEHNKKLSIIKEESK